MTNLPKAISDARVSRADLIKTYHDIRRRLSLPELAEDALRAIDPELTFLGRVTAGIQRNPLLAAALLAGAGWLAGGASEAGGRSNGNGSRHSHHRKTNEDSTTKVEGEMQ